VKDELEKRKLVEAAPFILQEELANRVADMLIEVKRKGASPADRSVPITANDGSLLLISLQLQPFRQSGWRTILEQHHRYSNLSTGHSLTRQLVTDFANDQHGGRMSHSSLQMNQGVSTEEVEIWLANIPDSIPPSEERQPLYPYTESPLRDL